MLSQRDSITDSIFNDDSRTLAPAAVGSQVILMTVVSAVTIIAFNLLRPNNKIIYEPKVKYHEGDKPPPKISDSLCGWLPPLLHTKEPELLDKVGLDAVTYLRFGRMLRWFFLVVTLLTCGILAPINVVYNTQNKVKKRDILSSLTIRDVRGDILFAHVVVSYLIVIAMCVFIWFNWREMVKLRRSWFRSPEYQESFYARTLQIRGVPKNCQSDQGIRQVFESTRVPYPTTNVHIGRKVGRLPELIEYHNDTVREFERVLVRYLKGGRIGRKRPTIRVGGSCGCGGVKKDAIEFYTAKLKRTEAAIEEYRNTIDRHKAESYGFASMASVPYAHIVAKQLEGKHPRGTTITLAPNPKDIIWRNMNASDAEIATKKIHGFLWLTLVCFLNTIPLLALSFLANLASLTAYVDFLANWQAKSSKSFAFISGVLPPIVSGIFGYFLPIIMRKLSRYMGALTHSRLDRAVVARYFFFLILSQLIIFTLIGVVFNSVKEIVGEVQDQISFQDIIANLHTLPQDINRTYIEQSSYWLTYFPLRGFLAIFDLAQIVNLLWLSLKTRLFGRTPRDIREWTKPPEFQYAIYYSNTLFMVAVGLVFAPLAPLVALAAGLCFWINSFVYKYQLMFVYVSKVESGGRLWNVIINRMLFCGILMQLLVILTIGLQKGWTSYFWISAVPPILIILGFKIYIDRAFGNAFQYYIPSDEEIRAGKVHSDAKSNRLERRFGHPSLHNELFTPMLHSKMMPLLSQVYSGKIAKEKTKLGEYGGQRMDAQVVEGIRIAAIDQSQLEYDPALYRRDRGELDWDARSIASTSAMSTMAMGMDSQYATSSATLLPGYDSYLVNGPKSAGAESYEMSTMDSPREPLLSPRSHYFQQQMNNPSQMALGPYGDPMRSATPLMMGPQADFGFPMTRSPSPFVDRNMQGYTNRSGTPMMDRSDAPSGTFTPQPEYQPYHQQAPSQQSYQQHPQQYQPQPPHRQYTSDSFQPQPPHRQYTSDSFQPQPPHRQFTSDPYQFQGQGSPTHSRQGTTEGNMAGRGAHRV